MVDPLVFDEIGEANINLANMATTPCDMLIEAFHPGMMSKSLFQNAPDILKLPESTNR